MELPLGDGDEIPGGTVSVPALALPPGTAILRQPIAVGSYSIVNDPKAKKREFFPSQLALKYLHCPPHLFQRAYFDLAHGYDPAVKWGEWDETKKLDELLKWINLHRELFQIDTRPNTCSLFTDFVAFRGVLTKIMCTPYENREGWMICATKFQDTIYLCQFKLLDDSAIEPDDFYKKLSFSGYRFEKYITNDRSDEAPDPFDTNFNFDEYCAVIRTRLAQHSMVYGAEVDATTVHELPEGIAKPPSSSMDPFVEIKTTRECVTDGQVESFWRHKAFKWWAQCYLAGIPKIICGYRNDKLVINSVAEIPVQYLAQQAESSRFWSPQVCINFLNRFLSHVKSIVREDSPEVVYQFVYHPEKGARRTDEDRSHITCRRLRPNERFRIIPFWYVKDFYDYQSDVTQAAMIDARFSP